MPTPSDYYAVLQVQPDAEPEVIDAAYRRLAAKYHPDVSRAANARERMVQLNAAYEVLSDPAKRRAYDANRRAKPQAASQAPTQPDYATRDPHRWLVTAGMIALILLAFRLGPRVVVPLAALAFVIWLLYKLRKRKQ